MQHDPGRTPDRAAPARGGRAPVLGLCPAPLPLPKGRAATAITIAPACGAGGRGPTSSPPGGLCLAGCRSTSRTLPLEESA